MKFIKYGVCITCITAFLGGMVSAQDYHTNSTDMVKELTRKPVKYRSFTPAKKRAIKVVQRIDQKVEETTIMVDDKADVPKLKVKIEFDVTPPH